MQPLHFYTLLDALMIYERMSRAGILKTPREYEQGKHPFLDKRQWLVAAHLRDTLSSDAHHVAKQEKLPIQLRDPWYYWFILARQHLDIPLPPTVFAAADAMGLKVFDDPVDGKGLTWNDVLKPARGSWPMQHPDMHARVYMVAVFTCYQYRDVPFYAARAKADEELTGDPMSCWRSMSTSTVNINLPADILQKARDLNIDSVDQILARYPDN